MLLLPYRGFFASSLLILQLLYSSTSARVLNSPRVWWPSDRRLSNHHTAVLSAATAFPSHRTWDDDADSARDFGNLNSSRTPLFSSWTAAWPSLPTMPSIRPLPLPRLPSFLRRRSTESTLQAVTDAFAACGGKSVSVYEYKDVFLIK